MTELISPKRTLVWYDKHFYNLRCRIDATVTRRIKKN